MVICEYLQVYRNNVLITDTSNLRAGDTLTIVVRTDRRPGYVFLGWVDRDGNRMDPYPSEVTGTEYPTFNFTIDCETYINAQWRQGITPQVTVTQEVVLTDGE